MLAAENAKLKRLLANAELDKAAPKDLLGRNGGPQVRPDRWMC